MDDFVYAHSNLLLIVDASRSLLSQRHSLFMHFSGLFWFLLMLLPLVFLQRLLHREIQAVLLIVTRNPQLTIGLFSVLFFPGVFLHETSHFVMAKILRVRTRNFSLIPTPLPDGRLQMGYVETERTDIVRDSLIGLAPLIAGSLFIAYAGLNRLGFSTLLDVLANGQVALFWVGLRLLPQVKDFYLWVLSCFCSFQHHDALRVRPPCLASAWSVGIGFTRIGDLRRCGHMDVGKHRSGIKRFPRCSGYLIWSERCFAYCADTANHDPSSYRSESHRGGCEIIPLAEFVRGWGFKPTQP